jgi:hypothetical protein
MTATAIELALGTAAARDEAGIDAVGGPARGGRDGDVEEQDLERRAASAEFCSPIAAGAAAIACDVPTASDDRDVARAIAMPMHPAVHPAAGAVPASSSMSARSEISGKRTGPAERS